jgi:hypothetical protein
MTKINLLDINNFIEQLDLLYTAKNVFSNDKFKLYSYLLFDGSEYIELTNYKNDILGNYEMRKVLNFSKINCIDNSESFDKFLNKKHIKLELSNLTLIDINSTIQITKENYKNLKSLEDIVLKTKQKKSLISHPYVTT